jgi:glycosyltransferase involved in cell wall biosynthesis
MVSVGCFLIRVGFIINFRDHGWIGGINYYKNLLNAISSLPDRQIEPVIFTGYTSDKKILDEFTNIQIIQSHIFDLYPPLSHIRHLILKLLQRDILLEYLLIKNDISLLSHYHHLGNKSNIPTLGWIPDFQHKYLPDFFSKNELLGRDRSFLIICRDCTNIIFSSNTAKNDAENFFPEYETKFRVLPFVTWDMNLHNLPDFNEIKERYNLDMPYFLVPNQFWVHKNHQIILEALGILKNKGYSMNIIATGNTHDYRNPQYYHDLQKKIQDYHISQNFKILGIIPYNHLIQLMRNSVAIINPSYFEGWSTIVEEAKILHLKILLSDISVHREQNPDIGQFFPPDDPQRLADLLLTSLEDYQHDAKQEVSETIIENLEKQKREFAQNYEKIVLDTLTRFRGG